MASSHVSAEAVLPVLLHLLPPFHHDREDHSSTLVLPWKTAHQTWRGKNPKKNFTGLSLSSRPKEREQCMTTLWDKGCGSCSATAALSDELRSLTLDGCAEQLQLVLCEQWLQEHVSVLYTWPLQWRLISSWKYKPQDKNCSWVRIFRESICQTLVHWSDLSVIVLVKGLCQIWIERK